MATAVAERVSFRCYGIPVTQGSMKAFMPRHKKTGQPLTRFPIVTHVNKSHLRPWRDAIASEALRARSRILEGALAVELHFHLSAPKSRPARLQTEKQIQHWTYPWRGLDVDKLARAALDAMTGILFLDDAQIVRLVATKRYSADPGVEITVEQMS